MRTILMTAIIVMLTGMPLAAEEAEDSVTTIVDTTTFEGTVVCMGCELKASEGARADCKAYGHKHALKTEDGKYIGFLANKYSKDLIDGKKYHNQKISIHGTYHAKANLFDVESFTANGKEMDWCIGCNTMDQCPFK